MRHLRLIVCAVIMLFISGVASAQQDIINNYAGGGPNNVPATSAPAVYPVGVAYDNAGNFYFSTQYTNQHRVFKVSTSGTLTVLAGEGSPGYSGDGGLATQAQLYYPSGIAVDSQGNLFIADEYNHIIREVNAGTGIISTIAGIPQSAGYNADGIPATTSYLYYPTGVAIDSEGNLIIADQYNLRIRLVACATKTSTGGACTPPASDTTGDIYTIAGDGTQCSVAGCGDGGLATSATLNYPQGVAVDSAGNIYVSDTDDALIRRVACGSGISGCAAPSGETNLHIYDVAGNGTLGYIKDGVPATGSMAELYYPFGIAIDKEGNLLIADQSNQRIREVACVTKTSTGGTCVPPSGETIGDIYTVAGNGSGGYGADGVPATGASGNISSPLGVAVDSSGDFIIADFYNLRVRLVACGSGISGCTAPAGDTTGDIYTVAGNGTSNFFGEGVSATGAILYTPTGTVSDSLGNIYIADYNNCVVREVNAMTGIITTFAGNYSLGCGYSGDGGPATSAQLYHPYHLAVDSSNNVYITDQGYCIVREVSGGNINTVVGNGTCGYSGDGSAATSAELDTPAGIAFDSGGNMYIADYYNQVIRKVSGGTITTFAGNYALSCGFSGDGGPATSAQLCYPNDVAVDAAGNLYIDDAYNWRIRKVNTSGTISTFAGNGSGGYQGDGGLAVETSLYYPQSVTVDSAGDVLIADYDNERIRLVDGAGYIHTVAGNGTNGWLGYGVLATTAEISQPQGVGTDPAGNIYVSDTGNDLIRQVSALAELNSSPSSVSFDTQQVGTTSPAATLTLNSAGPLTISSITPSANFTEEDDCPSSLSNGANCTVDVFFAPTSAGIIKGTLTIADNAFFNSPLVVNLQGTATGLTITPNPLAFGVVMDGSPVTQNVTVTGSTTYAANPVTLSGDTAYSIASNTCIGVKTSCVIGIAFNPSSAGSHNATLAIHDSDPTSAQLVPITGSGCVSSCSSAYETFTPSPVNFGPQTDKVSSTATKVTFTNNSSVSLTITKPVASTGFKVNTTGLSAPICSVTASTVVAPGGICSFNVVFDPTATGAANGTVKTTFGNDGHGNTSLTLTVTGEGSAISFTPSPVAFKAEMINTTSAKTKVTIKNVDSVSLTLTSLVSSSSSFVLSNTGLSPACNLSGSTLIASGATCLVDVAFAPGATIGTINGTITANYTGDPNGDTSRVLTVTGIGTEMKVTGSLAFSTVTNPNTSIKSVTVTNEGTVNATFTAPTITGTGAAEYSVLPYVASPPQSTCLAPSLSLGHLGTCTISVQFTPPTGSGTSFAADLNINTSGGGPLVVAISGKN